MREHVELATLVARTLLEAEDAWDGSNNIEVAQ